MSIAIYARRNDAEWLAKICRPIDSLGLCPARIMADLLCPLGDDGICENCTAKDWLHIFRVMEEAKK